MTRGFSSLDEIIMNVYSHVITSHFRVGRHNGLNIQLLAQQFGQPFSV